MIPSARPAVLLLTIAGITACGTGGSPQIPDAAGKQVASLSLLRWPVASGVPALYRFPTLDPAHWEGRGPAVAIRKVVGVDVDQRQAYAFDAKNGVVALDLESGRTRAFLTNIAAANVGPDGTVYAVGTDKTLSSISGRLPTAFPGKLPVVPTSLVGTGGDLAYALVPGDSGLVIANEGQAPRRLSFPSSGAVHSRWADVFASPLKDEVLLYEPGAAHTFVHLDVGGKPVGLAFSPSGHRLYATTEGDDEVQRFDRYGWDKLSGIDLPGAAGELRDDPLGRFLLVRAATGDSVWVVDAVKGELLGSWNTTWRDDLPAIAGGRWLVVREGNDVVCYDLFDPKFAVAGKVRGGSPDLWEILDWSPRAEGSTQVAADSSAVATPVVGGTTVYVQLSSSQNPAYADDFANKLKGQGLPASVIRPRRQDEFYRVVLGPYTSRESADSVGTRLGQPYFLYIPEER